MKKVIRFCTQDGRHFSTEHDARKHAEKIYGELLSSLAHGVVRIEKYTDAHTWLETHMEDFAMLSILRNDMELENGGDDE